MWETYPACMHNKWEFSPQISKIVVKSIDYMLIYDPKNTLKGPSFIMSKMLGSPDFRWQVWKGKIKD